MSWFSRVFGRKKEPSPDSSEAKAGLVEGETKIFESSNFLAELMGELSSEIRREDQRMLEAYNQNPWLNAVAGKIKDDVGRANWRVFRVQEAPDGRPSNPVPRAYVRAKRLRAELRSIHPTKRAAFMHKQMDSDLLEEVENHPVVQLLERGHSRPLPMSGMTVRSTIQLYLDLTGVALLGVEGSSTVQNGDRSAPAELYPFPRHFIDQNQTTESTVVFRDPKKRNQRWEFPADRVILFRQIDPTNPYSLIGSSPAKSVATEITTYEFAGLTSAARFKNFGVPTWVWVAKGLSKSGLNTLKAEVVKPGGSMRNAKTMHFTNVKDLDLHKLDDTIVEMAIQELQDFTAKVIRHVFGVPDEILGISDNSNRATSVTAERRYHAGTVDPRLRFIEETLQCFLMPMFPGTENEVLTYDSTVPDDVDFQLEVIKAMPGTAVREEARSLAGLPNMELEPVAFLNSKIPDKAGAVITQFNMGALSEPQARAYLKFYFDVPDNMLEAMLTKPEVMVQPPSPMPGQPPAPEPEDDQDNENGEGDDSSPSEPVGDE